tara:strand:- start:188 stop:874 length:687 start_codon:yes stop_codon:yes gene_type:complete
MDLIKLKEVWKTYVLDGTEFHALSGVNLEVRKGEFLAIIGPSGSGKSTMLNSVGALDVPSKGHIYLYGRDIAKMDESDLAQVRGKKIGFIFQAFNLISSLTALENIMLPMVFQGANEETRRKKGVELLNKVGLGDKLENLPGQLSGGQKQRVAIARSLANDPEIILADEPTGNLDSKTGKEIIDLLKHLKREFGKTLIIVTHDNSIAKQADRISYLYDGKITQTKVNK